MKSAMKDLRALATEIADHIIFNRTGYFSFLEEGKL